MISSGRIIDAPIERASCNSCGYGFFADPLTRGEIAEFYSGDYTVQRADISTEIARAKGVRDLIGGIWGNQSCPVSVLEIGCGAGALLIQLRDLWPLAELHGVEPAPRLARLAQEQGHIIHLGGLEDFKASLRFQAICSVNVMEHFPEPGAVFRQIASLLVPEGRYFQITPDGDLPGMELLFRDHISSFSSTSLARFALEAGLEMTATHALDGAMREFRLSVFSPGTANEAPSDSFAEIGAARERYLARVRNSAIIPDWTTFHIFGGGEMADLLNAYQPKLVEKSAGFVVDSPAQSEIHGKPLRALADIGKANNFLLAVHPRSQAAVQSRLISLGHNVASLDWGPERI
jgi:SAM-dependent methyltransferase